MSSSSFYSNPTSYFTSESVTEGHPDKLCDQISDGVLDAMLRDDPLARVACEAATTTGLILVARRDHDHDLGRHSGDRARDGPRARATPTRATASTTAPAAS